MCSAAHARGKHVRPRDALAINYTIIPLILETMIFTRDKHIIDIAFFWYYFHAWCCDKTDNHLIIYTIIIMLIIVYTVNSDRHCHCFLADCTYLKTFITILHFISECPPPGPVTNGRLLGNVNIEFSTRRLVCDPGYVPASNQRQSVKEECGRQNICMYVYLCFEINEIAFLVRSRLGHNNARYTASWKIEVWCLRRGGVAFNKKTILVQKLLIRKDSFYQSKPNHFFTKKTKIHFCNIRSVAFQASHLMESLSLGYLTKLHQWLIISPDKARKGVIYPLKTGIYALVGIS